MSCNNVVKTWPCTCIYIVCKKGVKDEKIYAFMTTPHCNMSIRWWIVAAAGGHKYNVVVAECWKLEVELDKLAC